MRRALRMQSVPAHTTFLLEISLHNSFFLAAILSVPILKMQHTDSSHNLTHKWHVSCVTFQKLNYQVTLAMASYKTSPKAFGNSGEHCNNAVKDTSHPKHLRGFGGEGGGEIRSMNEAVNWSFWRGDRIDCQRKSEIGRRVNFSRPGEWAMLEAVQSSTWRCLLPSQPNSKLWAIRQTACLHTHNPYKMEWSIKSITPPTAFSVAKIPP